MTLRGALIDGAAVFGLVLTDEQVNACMVYLAELEKWNQKINLTAIRDEREIISKHFIDSFSYLRGFKPGPGMALLDMGSGAGFPALPIKISIPDLLVIMVESVRKKATFLRHIIRTLRLEGVEVLNARTDALLPEHQAKYNFVTARAFADMATALKEGSLFLKPGGLMILSRGPVETVSNDAVAEQGLQVQARHEIILPDSHAPRAIWVFQKKD